MNFENINPENRTSVNMKRRQQRNRRVNNNLALRCCSFCRQPGHSINLCNDQRIQDFDNLCRSKKLEFEDSLIPIDAFQEWIYEYWPGNEQIIKAYAVSKCGALLRDRILNLIESIMIHLYGEEYLLSEDSPPPLVEDLDDNVEIDDINSDLIIYHIVSLLTQNEFRTAGERKFSIKCDLNKIESQEVCDCNICFEEFNITNFVKLNCNHEFCKECVKQTLKTCNRFLDPTCAYCRAPITNLSFKNNDVQSEFSEMII